jgi:hypothetical protein
LLVLVKNSDTKCSEDMVTDFKSDMSVQENSHNPANTNVYFGGRTSGKRNFELGL